MKNCICQFFIVNVLRVCGSFELAELALPLMSWWKYSEMECYLVNGVQEAVLYKLRSRSDRITTGINHIIVCKDVTLKVLKIVYYV